MESPIILSSDSMESPIILSSDSMESPIIPSSETEEFNKIMDYLISIGKEVRNQEENCQQEDQFDNLQNHPLDQECIFSSDDQLESGEIVDESDEGNQCVLPSSYEVVIDDNISPNEYESPDSPESSEVPESSSEEFERIANYPHSFPICDSSIHQVSEIQHPKPFTFESPIQSWQRVFQKYSPTTETLHSPVKHISTNVCPNVIPDQQILGMVWVCQMSEQFYYDNGIILLQKYFYYEDQLKMILRLNSKFINPDDMLKDLVDVNVLGSGSFGDVYRVRHRHTNQFYAVKFLKKTDNTFFTDHTESILSYLREKNFLIQARNSPYVVQFISSATFPNVSGLFLFFEWCLCDLRKYVNLVSWSGYRYVTQGMWNNVEEGITDVLVNVYQGYKFNLFLISLIYVFEIFCGLSFLADCNLVHQDLKPENIMISITLHLKIADFGLAYNTKFITRQSQIHLVNPTKLDFYESANYKPQFGGTLVYLDMEMCNRALRARDYRAYREINSDKGNLGIELTPPDKTDADFMNDLWACGIMAIELLFGGIHLLETEYMHPYLIADMGLKNSFRYNVLKITRNARNYSRYIRDGLMTYGGPVLQQLMLFISTIFLPRQIRSENYTKIKEVYRYSNKIKLAHIDIKKVEMIDVFQNLNLHNNNSFLYDLPEELIELLSKEMKPHYKTMKALLNKIAPSDDEKFFTLDPGIQQTLY